MRIAIVNGPFYPTPPAPTGAVQRAWSDLAEHFARQGHEVIILACRYPGQAKEETRAHGLRIRRRTSMAQGQRIYFDLIKDFLYAVRMLTLAPQADILVTNSFWMPVVARWRRSMGRVYVSVGRMPKGQMKLYRRAHRLHAVSQAVSDAIIAEAPALAPKIKIIPYPIDTQVFKPGPKRAQTAGGPRTILYTGRIHPEKGMELLIDAFARLDPIHTNLRLRLVGASSVAQGGGGEDFVAKLKLRAASEALPVEFCDPVFGREALARELQQADVYVYPSLAEQGETFGVAPLEAMATGLAPVVSNLACFKDFIHHERTGLIFDHRAADPAATLAAQLKRLIDDPAFAQRLGETGAKEAQSFGYAEVADLFLADFEEILKLTP